MAKVIGCHFSDKVTKDCSTHLAGTLFPLFFFLAEHFDEVNCHTEEARWQETEGGFW
jgi:hypothetical protein